jgi:hypothetical protein
MRCSLIRPLEELCRYLRDWDHCGAINCDSDPALLSLVTAAADRDVDQKPFKMRNYVHYGQFPKKSGHSVLRKWSEADGHFLKKFVYRSYYVLLPIGSQSLTWF